MDYKWCGANMTVLNALVSFGKKARSIQEWDSAKMGSGIVLSNDNRNALITTTVVNFQPYNSPMVLGKNLIPATGKFYWECKIISTTNASHTEYGAAVGISTTVTTYSTDYPAYKCRTGMLQKGYAATGYGYAIRNAGGVNPELTETQPNPSTADALVVNDVQGILFDADTRLLRFSFNGVIDTTQNVTVVAADYYPGLANGSYDNFTQGIQANFSEEDWIYSPPAGYSQLP